MKWTTLKATATIFYWKKNQQRLVIILVIAMIILFLQLLLGNFISIVKSKNMKRITHLTKQIQQEKNMIAQGKLLNKSQDGNPKGLAVENQTIRLIELTKLAKNANIEFDSIKPLSGEQSQSNLAPKRTQFVTTTHYCNILTLLNDLASTSMPLSVENLSIIAIPSSHEEEISLRVAMQIAQFSGSANPVGMQINSQPTTVQLMQFDNQQLRNPFNKSKANLITTALFDLSTTALNELHILGTLHFNQLPVMIISDPAGKIYTIKEGMLIGRERTKVIKITKNKIILQADNGSSLPWVISLDYDKHKI